MSEIGIFRRISIICAAWLATRNRIPRTYSVSNSTDCNSNFCMFELRYKDDSDLEEFLICEKPSWKGISGIGYSNNQRHAIWTEPCDPRPPSEGSDWIYGNISMPFSALGVFTTRFTRIYRAQSIIYNSILSYFFGEAIMLHFWMNIKERFSQGWFTVRFKFTPERMKILIKIVEWKRRELRDRKIRSLSTEFSHIELFTEIATFRAWGLSDHDRHLADLTFILDSLVSTGELDHGMNGRYLLNAQTLASISAYETDNRKERRSNWNNIWMISLTFVLAATAFLDLISCQP